jgi:hypothetical protein
MLSKETKRWLRALGIAKILFEDQGYHCLYLENIENFIRRKPVKQKALFTPTSSLIGVKSLYGKVIQ